MTLDLLVMPIWKYLAGDFDSPRESARKADEDSENPALNLNELRTRKQKLSLQEAMEFDSFIIKVAVEHLRATRPPWSDADRAPLVEELPDATHGLHALRAFAAWLDDPPRKHRGPTPPGRKLKTRALDALSMIVPDIKRTDLPPPLPFTLPDGDILTYGPLARLYSGKAHSRRPHLTSLKRGVGFYLPLSFRDPIDDTDISPVGLASSRDLLAELQSLHTPLAEAAAASANRKALALVRQVHAVLMRACEVSIAERLPLIFHEGR